MKQIISSLQISTTTLTIINYWGEVISNLSLIMSLSGWRKNQSEESRHVAESSSSFVESRDAPDASLDDSLFSSTSSAWHGIIKNPKPPLGPTSFTPTGIIARGSTWTPPHYQYFPAAPFLTFNAKSTPALFLSSLFAPLKLVEFYKFVFAVSINFFTTLVIILKIKWSKT